VLFISGTKITAIGKENMPNEATLYVGNHRSFFDILIMCTQHNELMGFVAKDSLGKIPSLRIWMRYIYCLFLNRKDLKQGMKTILQAIEYIKQGVSIAIFPEGTRNKGEELSVLPFKEGSFKIALKTGCPIVPVAINNSADIFESHFPKIKKNHVVIEYGKPIYPKELDKETAKHIGKYVQDIIQETINKNHELV
jgi:1-acyl-sn-glycerol-3-phosphate acyltransferase